MTRLDVLLVERGLYPSRTQAQEAIRSGGVTVNGVTAVKPGQFVSPDALLTARPGHGYVGRGGAKLSHALLQFNIDVVGRTALDVGASTGGFTDCLLRSGAARVYAVDVGHGQLADILRQDPRVVSLEGVDIRTLRLPEADRPTLAVVDVSFISLRLVLPALPKRLVPGADVICLVKPQFEVGPDFIGKGGLVRDPALHRKAVDTVAECARSHGFFVRGETPSPITGGDGNKEFFLWLISHT